jgi:AcrR family transcriptional regulator
MALVLERSWDEVSVLDVCERAEVGRSTFYTHFAHKEALLLSGFDDLRENLRAQKKDPSSSPSFLRGLIEHAEDHRRIFRALIGKRAGQLAQKGFREFVLTLVREDLSAAFLGTANLEPAARYVSGGICEVLIWSVDARPAPQTTELEALCLQFSKPVLATLR